jgi:hypothetical protein
MVEALGHRRWGNSDRGLLHQKQLNPQIVPLRAMIPAQIHVMTSARFNAMTIN